MQTRNLPSLVELHHAPVEAYKNDQYNLLLNQEPHADWVRKHPLAKTKNDKGQEVPARYLPIEKIEYMLTRIYGGFSVEVLREGLMANAVYVTVRLHLIHPVTGKPFFTDGVGAKSVQVNSGASPSDISQIKDAGVMMALPSAKSYAIKDAAQNLGRLFGRDLNRSNLSPFQGAYGAAAQAPAPAASEPEKPVNNNYSTTNEFPL